MAPGTWINSLFLALATAAFLLMGFPASHAEDPAEAPKKNDTAADLRRQEAELRSALKANPNDAEAHFKLGRFYIDRGNWSAAVTELRAARRSGLDNADVDAQLAWALYLQSDYGALFREIKPGDRNAQAESTVRMSLGLAYLYTFDFANADRLLHDAVRLDPGAWRARIALARFLILTRKLPEAREQLAEASKLAPDQAGITRIAGELLHAEGDTAGAIAAFTKVLKRYPSSAPALAGRADALIIEDKLPDAARDVRQALKFSRHPQLSFLAALILAREDKLAEADQALMAISGTFDRMPIGYYLYGVVKFRRGLVETAESNLAKFMGKQPNISGAARLRAEIALRRKDPAAAVEILEPFVKANPADHEATISLARAYLAAGSVDQVMKLFEESTTASPKAVASPDPTGLLMMYGDAIGDLVEIEKLISPKAPKAALVLSELRQGNVNNAATMAEALAGSAPDDPVVQNVLGSVRLAQKRLPEAETIYRLILVRNRDFMPAALSLAEVLVAQKKPDEARAVLRDLTQRS